MKLPACTSNNSLLEGDIETASQRETITHLEVLETENGLCVAIEIKLRTGKNMVHNNPQKPGRTKILR